MNLNQEQQKALKAELTTLVDQIGEVTRRNHEWRRECKTWVFWPATLMCIVVPTAVAAWGTLLGVVCAFVLLFIVGWLLIGLVGLIIEWFNARGRETGLKIRGRAERAVSYSSDRDIAAVAEQAREYIAIRRNPWRYFRGCWDSQEYRNLFKDA